MDNEALRKRTKSFALRIIKLIDALPNTRAGNVIANQLVRSATSVGANYRAACRGRSTAEFYSKLHIVLEEADECLFWLEIIQEAELLPLNKTGAIVQEANELTAIFAKSCQTVRNNR
jgi:four helix bundle protein